MNSSQLPLHHLPPTALHLHAIPPGLQPLEDISPEAAFFPQRYAQHLAATPAPHALHFQGHGLQQSGQQPFEGFAPGAYGRFELSAPPNHPSQPPPPPPPLPSQQQQQQRVQGPPPGAQVVQAAQRTPHPQELEPRNDFVQGPAQIHDQAQGQDGDEVPVAKHGQFEGLKLIPDPPNLESWRGKLFHVDDSITLTEEEYVCSYRWQCGCESDMQILGSRPISRTSIMFTPTGPHNGISVNGLYHIIGTAGLKDVRRERRNPQTQRKRSGNV